MKNEELTKLVKRAEKQAQCVQKQEEMFNSGLIDFTKNVQFKLGDIEREWCESRFNNIRELINKKVNQLIETVEKILEKILELLNSPGETHGKNSHPSRSLARPTEKATRKRKKAKNTA